MVTMVRKRGSHEYLFGEKNSTNCAHHNKNYPGFQQPTPSPSSAPSAPTANTSIAVTSCSGSHLSAEDPSTGNMAIDNGVAPRVAPSKNPTWV